MTIPEGTQGYNDSGERYFLAPSLVAFRHSVNVAYPNRDYESDGWIGDAAHAARVSEHNPDWAASGYMHGVVRAIDITNDPALPEIRERVLASAINHPAVWYVISNGKIYSRTYDWVARDYTGANQHRHHVHISINKDLASAKNTTFTLKTIVRETPDMALSKEDRDFITGECQRFAIANNEYLRQMVDDIGNYAAAATDAAVKNDFDAVNQHLNAISGAIAAVKAP